MSTSMEKLRITLEVEERELPDGMIQPRPVREKVVSRTFTAVLGLAICAISYRLWSVPLRSFFIKLDDYDYLIEGRTAAALGRYLFRPHFGHAVPLFRLETHILGRVAGSLEALPGVLGWACFVTLVLAILLTGHLVARETGRPGRGLAAMAVVGFSSVLGPAVLWYAASQALACGTMILAMLAALQLWRARGGYWPLVLGLLAAMAAPLLWTPGYIAGLVGAAYLLADGRRRFRLAAVLPLAVSVLSWVVVRVVLIPLSGEPLKAGEVRLIWGLVKPGPAFVYTAQDVCELMLKNVGLDTANTGPQAVVIVAILVGVWFWSRRRFDPNGARRWPRVNPLEAAGAVLIAASLGMIYAVRGQLGTFEEMRTQGWYDAIADLGAVLFVFGWHAGPTESPPPRTLEYAGRQDLLVSVLVVAVIFVLQAPRVERVIFRYDGMGAWPGPDAPNHPPVLSKGDIERRARDQRQALAELDRVERTAREKGQTRDETQDALNKSSRIAVIALESGSGGRLIELLDIPENPANAD
jgi:hypothetical protein